MLRHVVLRISGPDPMQLRPHWIQVQESQGAAGQKFAQASEKDTMGRCEGLCPLTMLSYPVIAFPLLD